MSDQGPLVGNLRGVGRPSAALRRMIAGLHGGTVPQVTLDEVIDDAVAVDTLAKLLDQAMTESTTADGRLDLREVAVKILRTMKDNQR